MNQRVRIPYAIEKRPTPFRSLTDASSTFTGRRFPNIVGSPADLFHGAVRAVRMIFAERANLPAGQVSVLRAVGGVSDRDSSAVPATA